MTPTTVQHRTTFRKVHEDRTHAEFEQVRDDGEEGHALDLLLSSWTDLGEPDVITVTVQPGDLLNDAGP